MNFLSNIRITKSIFKDLKIIMIFFGILIGLIFPFVLNKLFFNSDNKILTPIFFIISTISGVGLGVFNYGLVSSILKMRFRTLINSMNRITGYIDKNEQDKCNNNNCEIFFNSNDEIGETATTFNTLISSLRKRIILEEELRSFTYMLNEHIELKPLTYSIIKNCVEKSGANAGIALMFDDDNWKFVNSYGVSEDEINKEILYKKGGLVNSIIKNRKILKLEVMKDIPIKISGFGLSFKPTNYIIFPIIYHNKIIGVFIFISIIPFKESCIDVFTLVSSQIGNSFQNSLLHAKIKEIAVIDPLTNTYNRRFGMRRLKEEYSKAMRFKSHLSVVMLDIDFFKKVNDTYGHQAGDKVLQIISSLLKNSIREGDILCRYGGEEFLMILPGSSGEDSIKMANRVRRIIETQIIIWENSKIEVTVSFGVASCYGLEGCKIPKNNESRICSEDELIRKADNALYLAKETGRNKVILSSD